MMTKTNRSNEELALIVVAAGSSSRMGGIKKEYLPLESGTVLSTAVKAFLRTLPFSVVAVTFPNQENPELLKSAEEKCKNALFEDKEFNKIANNTEFIFVPGGASRQSSVFNALLKIKANFPNSNPVVFIHDGARPFVSKKIINSTFAAVQKYGASAPGIQPTDTQNEIDKNGFIKRHLVRSQLTAVQTPQVFMLNELVEAHKKAQKTKKEYTDDTEIWDLFVPEGKVKIVDGDIKNKKITYREDFFTEPEINAKKSNETNKGNKMIRTGLGYDKHALVAGRALMLGGIKFDSELGEDGHSDGDVLLHAITDALLGACGMGDIGSFFPPSDPKWKDADSRILLGTVWNKITQEGWKLENLDCVIALEKPKFLPRRQEVIDSIAKILQVKQNQVFVKAKTGEKLGDVGQSRAVEVWVTCLLSK